VPLAGIVNITGNWTRTASYEGHSVNYTKDISVQEMISFAADVDPARVQRIVEAPLHLSPLAPHPATLAGRVEGMELSCAGSGQVLDIDLGWRMHIVSDGQRRRVQLLMGLMKNWQVSPPPHH
jgi:hypothetical protein